MYVLAKDLHALPKTGGLLDQDWLHIEIFRIITSVFSEEAVRDAKKVH